MFQVIIHLYMEGPITGESVSRPETTMKIKDSMLPHEKVSSIQVMDTRRFPSNTTVACVLHNSILSDGQKSQFWSHTITEPSSS